jgi:hypothetical protein
MNLIDYIGKALMGIIGGVGLLFSTEQVVLEVNYEFIIGAIISSILCAYGLYHAIKDAKEYFN